MNGQINEEDWERCVIWFYCHHFLSTEFLLNSTDKILISYMYVLGIEVIANYVYPKWLGWLTIYEFNILHSHKNIFQIFICFVQNELWILCSTKIKFMIFMNKQKLSFIICK